MISITKEADEIMTGRFQKDAIIALATVENGIPYVRDADA